MSEPVSPSPPEHPGATLPEHPGATLKEARQRRGASVADVAETLHLHERVVEALEEGRSEHLPARVYVRGYARAYARLLGLDEDDISARFEAAMPKPAAPSGGTPPSAVLLRPTLADRAQRHLGVLFGVVVVIVLVGAALALWWASRYYDWSVPNVGFNPQSSAVEEYETVATALPERKQAISSTANTTVETAPQTSATASAAALVDSPWLVDAPAGEPSLDDAGSGASEMAQGRLGAGQERLGGEGVRETSGAGLATREEGRETHGASEEGREALDEGRNALEALDEGQEAAAAADRMSLVDANAPPEATPDATPEAAPELGFIPAEGDIVPAISSVNQVAADALTFRFNEESWVEVRDGAGALIYEDLGAAGQIVRVTGNAPFSVLVGYAAGVQLTYNNDPVALAPHTRQAVARLVVGY